MYMGAVHNIKNGHTCPARRLPAVHELLSFHSPGLRVASHAGSSQLVACAMRIHRHHSRWLSPMRCETPNTEPRRARTFAPPTRRLRRLRASTFMPLLLSVVLDWRRRLVGIIAADAGELRKGRRLCVLLGAHPALSLLLPLGWWRVLGNRPHLDALDAKLCARGQLLVVVGGGVCVGAATLHIGAQPEAEEARVELSPKGNPVGQLLFLCVHVHKVVIVARRAEDARRSGGAAQREDEAAEVAVKFGRERERMRREAAENSPS
mmetsp:Transcript_56791/g.130426  ORF Transcript_56791/g.130426 Transcript_56791/m.130426 type:complete len:264 (+) Transcript_56791:131-922(+)